MMNLTDNMIKTPITKTDEIACGMLVSFRCRYDSQTGKWLLARGFIRQVHEGVALISAFGIGNYRVPANPEWIRYRLSK